MIFAMEVMQINKSKGAKPKMTEHKLRSGVNWQGALERAGNKNVIRLQHHKISMLKTGMRELLALTRAAALCYYNCMSQHFSLIRNK